jgi:hypothetical protein
MVKHSYIKVIKAEVLGINEHEYIEVKNCEGAFKVTMLSDWLIKQ